MPIVLPWMRIRNPCENYDPISAAKEEAFREAQRIYGMELERVLKEVLPKMVQDISGHWPRIHLCKEWTEFEEPMVSSPTGLKPLGFKVILFPPRQS